MDFLFSFVFLLLNLYSYQWGMNRILFLFLSAALFVGMYYYSFKRTGSFLVSSMIMMCHTWQASWTDVFGVSNIFGEGSQITWFYIVGLSILIYAVINMKEIVSRRLPTVTLALFFSWVIIMLYPLFPAPSKSEAIKELLVTGYFFILSMIAFCFLDKEDEQKRNAVVSAFIFNMTLTAAFLIVQYAAYQIGGIILFHAREGNYLGGFSYSAGLLMSDTSSSTIIIAAAIFYVFEKLNKKNWIKYVAVLIILMVGLAVTTRRTSILTLCPFMLVYVFMHYKGVWKKALLVSLSLLLIAVMLYYLSLNRSINDLNALLYDNGRFEGYLKSIEIFKNNIFGVGYDNSNLENLMSGISVHNTFLRWLNMGGIPFTLLSVALIVLFIVYAYKKPIKTEFWFLIYAFAASNVIPDLLNARLAVLPVMMVFIFGSKEGSGNEKNIAVQSRNELQSRM